MIAMPPRVRRQRRVDRRRDLVSGPILDITPLTFIDRLHTSLRCDASSGS
jgi:hypothetical protein